MSFPYPNQRFTSNLGLSLFGMDEVLADNMNLIDQAYGAGSSVFVNGSLVTSPNFNGTTPAAPGGKSNITFQVDINGNVSAYSSGGGGTGAWATLTGDLTETQVIPFDGASVGTPDTGISRIGAASLAIGNGTAGDFSGSLKLTSLSVRGTLTDGSSSVGTSGQVLSSTVTGVKWIAQSSGTPGGSNTQIQFNNSSAFGGDANLTWNTTGVNLTVGPTTNIAYSQLVSGFVPTIYTENTQTGLVGTTDTEFTFPYSFNSFLNPPSDSSIELFNINGFASIQAACASNFTSEICGAHFEGDHYGTGNVAVLIGNAGEAYNFRAGTVGQLSAISGNSGTLADHGTVTTLSGVESTLYLHGTGAITSAYGLLVNAPSTGAGPGFWGPSSGGSTVTTYAQLYIANPGVVGTANTWGVYSAGGDNYFANAGNFTYISNLLMNDGSASTPSIRFTSDTDLGLYKAGTDALGIAGNGVLLQQIDYAFGTTITGGDLGFSNTTVAARDINLHRVGAGVLGVGTGAFGNLAGTMQANTFQTKSGANFSVFIDYTFGVTCANGQGLRFGAANANSGDAGLTRLGAASLAIGNGTLNDTTGKLSFGSIPKYNGTATVRNGIAAEYANSDLTAQSAAITATTLLSAPQTGVYKVSWSATITTASDISSVLGGTNGFQVIYTSPTDSVVKTTVPGNSVTSSANTTGTALGGVEVIYAKTGTNIQFSYGYTDSHTSTAMVYELHITVEAL